MIQQQMLVQRVRSLEHRAEELLTISEDMKTEEAKQIFRQLAQEYQEMAARRQRQMQ